MHVFLYRRRVSWETKPPIEPSAETARDLGTALRLLQRAPYLTALWAWQLRPRRTRRTQSDASAEGTRFGDSSTDADVTIQTDILGGAGGALENVSRHPWAQTLKHNSTWAVIDRANPLAVWELVPFDKNLTDDAKRLAPLLGEVWVRRRTAPWASAT